MQIKSFHWLSDHGLWAIIIHSKYFPVSEKVQPAENYWTDYVKMTSKVQPAADYWTVNRENLGTRVC